MERTLIDDIAAAYGILVIASEPVEGGWLNLKWRITTSDGQSLLVKQFDCTRYSKKGIGQIEQALRHQVHAHKSGVKCPRILQVGGSPMRCLDGKYYMIMEYMEGGHITPYSVNAAQMQSLGEECARMHKAFAEHSNTDACLPSYGGYTIERVREVYTAICADLREDDSHEYISAVRTMGHVLETLPIDIISRCPRGFAHEDFTPDNLLFSGDELSAIIDFDRCCYSMPIRDVGRAILSLALRDGELDMELVRAFKAGYNRHGELTDENISDALRLTWCIESIWWINREYFEHTKEKLRRFREEILWLGDNFYRLYEIIQSTTT